MAAFAPIAVVGGPLRTGRASAIDRVIRIQHAPARRAQRRRAARRRGRALGIITSTAIRGTTVVIPASLAWAAATKVVDRRRNETGLSRRQLDGGADLPERQRAGRAQNFGLLVSQVSPNSPADAAGLMVGDVIVAFDGESIEDARRAGHAAPRQRVGKPVPITVLRGARPSMYP